MKKVKKSMQENETDKMFVIYWPNFDEKPEQVQAQLFPGEINKANTALYVSQEMYRQTVSLTTRFLSITVSKQL